MNVSLAGTVVILSTHVVFMILKVTFTVASNVYSFVYRDRL